MRIAKAIIFLALIIGCASPSPAQTFLQYRCDDGAQFSAMFPDKERRAFLQLDGKSLILPQRLAASGARYAKGGVTFWIKGNDAQLKRPKSKWTQCRTG
jgi:membrane-bound inhibitor of C-type lysozyme